MRFNEREMKMLGKAHNADKEGRLFYRRSLSSKGQTGTYKYKWFRLRGNLLFSFKLDESATGPESEPVGVMILERCKIQHEPFSDRNHVFSLSFLDDSADKKHYFSSASQAQSEEWVTLLRKASYEQLRATLIILQAQILKHTGQDPMEAFRHNLQSVMKQAGEGIEPKPNLRVDGADERHRRGDSRRKGVSAREAEIKFSEPMEIDITNLPFLDLPLTPIRKQRRHPWDS